MRRVDLDLLFLAFLLAAAALAGAQGDYEVVAVTNGGTISGSVKWSGPAPRILDFPVTKDPQICDPDSRKRVDLERLIIGPQGGAANTVVYLKNISRDAGTWTSGVVTTSLTFSSSPKTQPFKCRVPMPHCTRFTWKARPLSTCPSLFPTRWFLAPCRRRDWFICAATAVMSG
jgi:hypothetical protein